MNDELKNIIENIENYFENMMIGDDEIDDQLVKIKNLVDQLNKHMLDEDSAEEIAGLVKTSINVLNKLVVWNVATASSANFFHKLGI